MRRREGEGGGAAGAGGAGESVRQGAHPVPSERWAGSHVESTTPSHTGTRWRKSAHARDRARSLSQLAEWLPEQERALMQSAFGDGKPTREIAALLGVSPRRVRDLIRRLARRVASPEYAFVALNRDAWREGGDRCLYEVATLCVLGGVSVRQAAKRLGLGLHAVRQARTSVLTMASASASAGRIRKTQSEKR